MLQHFVTKNKSSAVAEMGDRLAAIDMGQKVGAAVPLSVGAERPSLFGPCLLSMSMLVFGPTIPV